jgi:hypothetical protein
MSVSVDLLPHSGFMLGFHLGGTSRGVLWLCMADNMADNIGRGK